jgi:hypothetical protein
MSLGDDGNLPSVSDPLCRDCGLGEVVGLVLMEVVGHVCEWCDEIVDDDDGFVEVRGGLWYRYGETGLVGRLSGCDELVLAVVGSSQNLASSESSDIGEYCNGKSSL